MNRIGKSGLVATSTAVKRQPLSSGIIAGAMFLIVGGLTYRFVEAQIEGGPARRISLRRPLATLPMNLNSWTGHDAPIPAEVLTIAGYDDTISRRYDNRSTGESVAIFIGFSGQPRTMPRHHPLVCYPTNGHTHLGTRAVELRDARSQAIASIHSFLKPGIPETRTHVLNYYVLDGVFAKDEDNVLEKLWKTPKLGGYARHYVAQVEISTSGGTDAAADYRRLTEFAEQTLQTMLALVSDVAD